LRLLSGLTHILRFLRQKLQEHAEFLKERISHLWRRVPLCFTLYERVPLEYRRASAHPTLRPSCVIYFYRESAASVPAPPPRSPSRWRPGWRPRWCSRLWPLPTDPPRGGPPGG